MMGQIAQNQKIEMTHEEMANAIRFLAMDAVEKAQSGHPGMPMGMADVATVLFRYFLKFDPENPFWPDRDRFILSNGHGSMLQYAILYLTGYEDMTIEEIKNFRQLGSMTPGHPEYIHTIGIETTTGPLGQGLGNAIGMAVAERHLAAQFGEDLVNHYTYVFLGDGCLMEGISHEVCSLAGHLKLNKLIAFFDDNQVSIDGSTSLATSDQTLKRFEAYNWNVMSINGHNSSQIYEAITKAQKSDRPVLIACKTTIAYGAPNKSGKAVAHGSPLGETEIKATREKLGWTAKPFDIPKEILNEWRQIGQKGAVEYNAWKKRLEKSSEKVRDEFLRRYLEELPIQFEEKINEFKEALIKNPRNQATRQSSGEVIEHLVSFMPELLGGSADLTGSNNTYAKNQSLLTSDHYAGTYLHYGVREHGMAAIMNGIALHKGIIPYGGSFLCFTDYCRPAIRLAALMGLKVIFVMTHDSIGLGEDGPTHQPIEHLMSLRSIPNLLVLRPADAVEVLEAWEIALSQETRPSVIALSRQKLPALRKKSDENLLGYGAYILEDSDNEPPVVTLLATGSEVSIACDVRKKLIEKGYATRVVSMPSWELFEEQSLDYQEEILSHESLIFAIEAGTPYGWERYVSSPDHVFGIPTFGASGKAEEVYRYFGLTADDIAESIEEELNIIGMSDDAFGD